MMAQENFLAKRGGLFGLSAGLLAELKSNRRAVVGLLAILALVAGYGLLPLGDAIDATRASYIDAHMRLWRIAAAGDEKDWPARAEASRTLREALDKRLWAAESDGVAQANLQDWVTGAGRAVGLEKLRVSVELTRPKGLAPDLRQIVATISAVQTDTALMRFLDRIALQPHLLVVDRLHVQQRPITLLEMTLISYARIVRPRGSTTP
jgi:type II secretion system (T2SS) protein M